MKTLQNIKKTYLLEMVKFTNKLQEIKGEEYTSKATLIIGAIVVGGFVLGLATGFIPVIWDMITERLLDLFK